MMPSSEPSLPDHSLLGAGALGPEFFYLSSDGQFVLLSIEPVAETVDVKMLQGLLQQSAFRNYQISDKALQEAAKSLNELKEPPAEGVESKSHSLTSSPTFALRVSGGGFPLLGDSCSRSTWFLLHRAA